MEKSLIIARPTKHIEELQKKLKETGDKVKLWDYSDLALSIIDGKMSVQRHLDSDVLENYGKVVVMIAPEEKYHMFSAVGCYCRKNKIKMLDETFADTSGKLYEMFRFAEKDLPVPDTFYGSREFLSESLAKLGGVGVLKAIHGTKGRDNYLVKSAAEIEKIIDAEPEKDFILQEFIPNEGDYRIIAFEYEPKLAIFRTSHGKDHRNNTSVGGSAKIIPLADVKPEILDTTRKATKALGIRLAGVDIIRNKFTDEHALLEINRTPQLASGSFVDEKFKIIQDLIRS